MRGARKTARRWRRRIGYRNLSLLFALAAIASWWFVLELGGWDRTPSDIDDACVVLTENPHWYRYLRAASREWEVDGDLLLAIVRTESGFQKDARPPRRERWGFLPGRRISSAHGYAQATDAVWGEFEAAKRGINRRRHFGDSMHFIGWYLARAQTELGIDPDQAQDLYLSYHQGFAGYRSGRWRGNEGLRRLARRVEERAAIYAEQLVECRPRLERRRWLRLIATWLGAVLFGWFVWRGRRR